MSYAFPNGMYEDLTMIDNFKRYNLTGREGLAFTLEIGRLAGFFIFPMDFVLHGRVAASGNTYTARVRCEPTVHSLRAMPD